MTYGKPTDPLPTLFIPHGGGPCFFMDWTMGPADTWRSMEQWLRQLGGTLAEKPQAIIVVSGHWEESPVRVNCNPRPPLLFDYYGFPPHTYQLSYPAPGAPPLAEDIRELLGAAGIDCGLESERGLDHGVFVPFLLIYPRAEIPIVQLSLHASLDARTHLRMGEALQPLRSRGVLIVGSGMSFHNSGVLRGGGGPIPEAERFDNWLTAACTGPAAKRSDQLCQWASAPAGRFAHPREEHLIPLMVAAGAGGDDRGVRLYSEQLMNMRVSAFQFGA